MKSKINMKMLIILILLSRKSFILLLKSISMLILTLKWILKSESISIAMNQLEGFSFFLSLTEWKKGGRQVGTLGSYSFLC